MAAGAKDIAVMQNLCSAWQQSGIDNFFCSAARVKPQPGLVQPKLLLFSTKYSCIHFYFL